jgi:hypothetical protein
MELYLDTANVAEVERLARIFPIAGVTTNPSIVAASWVASGGSFWQGSAASRHPAYMYMPPLTCNSWPVT